MNKFITPSVSLSIIIKSIHMEYFKHMICTDYKLNLDFQKIKKLLAVSSGYSIETVNRLVLLLEMYSSYLENMNSPNKRDYSILVKILKACTELFSTDIENAIDAHKFEGIENVIDIGAGHFGYAKIITKVLPSITNYIAIDKRSLDCDEIQDNLGTVKYTIIEKDIFDVFDDLLKEYKSKSSNTLIVISEFLHCKIKNMDILKSLSKYNYNIMIIEPFYDLLIDVRLHISGGELIDFNRIYPFFTRTRPIISMSSFNTLFTYYICGVKNAEINKQD